MASAIDGQRFNQRLLEHSTTTTTPQFRTIMNIERNANGIYTRMIFKEVQKEIYKSITLCYISNHNIVNGIHTYCVTHQDSRKDMKESASANHDTNEEEYQINSDGCYDVDDKLEDSEEFEVNEDDYSSN
ncbi:hypothetical protein R6Q57_015811 [Mikania cordata]